MSTPGSDSQRIVRPYALTGGRTRTQRTYPLEALVVTTLDGERMDRNRGPESQAICELCVHTRSLAEIAAHLQIPFGVTRVLVGDLVDTGLVRVFEQTDDSPDSELLERVLSGLRKL
jgi:hypothetical protein